MRRALCRAQTGAMAVAPTSVRPRGGYPWLVAILLLVIVGLVLALLHRSGTIGGSSSPTVDGSGVAASQVRPLPAFDRIELAGSNNVVVHVGGRQSVVVHADDNLIDRVTTSVRSRELVVGNRPGSFTTRSPMSVEVTVPALTGVSLSGSGTVTGSGRATRLEIAIAGSGTAQLSGLVAQDVRAIVSGSGSIFLTATRSLDATVSGTGSILYAGNPARVARNVTGTGAVTSTP